MKKRNKLLSLVTALSLGATGISLCPSPNFLIKKAQATTTQTVKHKDYRDGKYDNSLNLLHLSEQHYQLIKDSVYCIRHSAVYEELRYNKEGKVQKKYHNKVSFGTGFIYKAKQVSQRETEYFIATNHHVITMPLVIQQGRLKRVSEKIEIVDNGFDKNTSDDITLELLLKDKDLDIAVLKTKQKDDVELNDYPYGIGKSQEIVPGNIIRVEGYSGAVIKTTTQGIVSTKTNPEKHIKWDDNHFIIDAAINSGNSGSPAFALRDGNWEWVGITHAKLELRRGLPAEGSAFVIVIDKFKHLLNNPNKD